MELLPADEVLRAARQALAEDMGAAGDVTTLATVPAETRATARMVAREPLTVAGLAFVEATMRELSRAVQVTPRCRDGETAAAGATLIEVSGPARAILAGERAALNFVQRLSGIATLTAQFVAAVRGTKAQILDTRKTTPGWRVFEKYAVRCGGGRNHRVGLFDQVLIKDNHLAALREAAPNPIAAAVLRARLAYPQLQVTVEVDTLAQADQALQVGADRILLDNMPPSLLQEAVNLIQGRAVTEASGGVNLATVRAIAETGVDCVSVGALTHSARAVDIALDFVI